MTIQKVIESLNAYTGDEQTLNDFVAVANAQIGPDWTDKIYTELSNIPSSLKEKLDHAFNYYAATTAWNEIQTYINQAEPLDYAQTLERVPVLEHWLAFFGAAGEEAVSQLQKRLKKEGENQSHDTSVLDEPFATVVSNSPVETAIANEASTEAAPQNFKPDFVGEEVNVAPLSEEELQDRINDIFSGSDEMEAPSEDTSVLETIQDPAMPQVEPIVVMDEIQNSEPQIPSVEGLALETQGGEQESITSAQPPVKTLASVVNQEQPTKAQLAQETTQNIPLTTETESQWRVGKIFKQLDFVISIQAWVSKRCHDLGYTDYYTYRYYGFLVDVLDTTITELKEILTDTKLYDLIEKRQPDGVRFLQNQLLAFEKESKEAHEGVLSDLSPLPREGLSVDDLKRNLGAMDTTNAKEYLGPAPDGFEIVGDPYANLSDEAIQREYAKIEETGDIPASNVPPVEEKSQIVQTSNEPVKPDPVKNQAVPVNNTSQTPRNGVQRKMSFNLNPKKPSDSGASGA